MCSSGTSINILVAMTKLLQNSGDEQGSIKDCGEWLVAYPWVIPTHT